MPDALKSRVAAAIRTGRTRRGLSQEALAAEVGISLPGLGNIERGVNLPGVETLVTLIEALDLDPRAMLVPPARTGKKPSRDRLKLESEITAAVHGLSDRDAAVVLELAESLARHGDKK